MLWGATSRSPHPRARIRRIDITAALRIPGVSAVLTAADVPGWPTYGLERADQPVLAFGEVRHQGEPIAVVAADHPETARAAAAAVAVDYEVFRPICDPIAALLPDSEHVHPTGNLVRHVPIRRGDVAGARAAAAFVVIGDYEVGMQDQAFLGPESGLAVPAEDGGIDLYVATQWLHVDRDQVARSLGLTPDQVRITLAGVGGAFGAREDLSMQLHASMLALHTGRPVKMVYKRNESFFGHVHRHPARMRYEHGVDADGRIRYVCAKIVLDGGAYTSSSPAVAANAATLGVGPYEVPNVEIDAYAVFTNNPPCGAMRGFGAVQAAFAYESQLDAIAERLGIDPVELRIRNAMSEGSVMPTGQVIDSPAPVAELLRRVAARPLPPPLGADADQRLLPGGVAGSQRGGDPPGRRLRGGHQERRVLRGLRGSLHCPGAIAGRRRGALGRGAHRRRRGRPGTDHRAGTDRPHGTRCRRRRGEPGGHQCRQRGLHLGVAADFCDRGSGAGRVRGRACRGVRPRRAPTRPRPHRPRGRGGFRARPRRLRPAPRG